MCCDHCNHWVHHTCNALNDVDCRIQLNKNECW